MYEIIRVMEIMPHYTRTYFITVLLIRSEVDGLVMRLYIPKEH